LEEESVKPLGALVRNAQSGDLGAYGEIVRRFQDMAVGYAHSVLGDFHLAEDASQDAFIGAFLDLPKLREPEAFASWFRSVVRKHSDRQLRRRRPDTVSLDAVPEVPSLLRGPDDLAESSEVKRKVRAALTKLPEPERAVTTLCYISGYSQREVGDFLQIPVTTVKNRLRSARAHLRERMMDMVQDNLQPERPSRDASFGERVMEDLVRLSQRDVQIVLWKADITLRGLALALKGRDPELQNVIYQNMSERLGAMVREEMVYSAPQLEDGGEKVTASILEAVRELEESGRISWPSTEEMAKPTRPFKPDPAHVANLEALKATLGQAAARQMSYDDIADAVRRLAENARRLGILSFGDFVDIVHDRVFRLGIRLVLDGNSWSKAKAALKPCIRTVLQHDGTRYQLFVEGALGIRNADHPRTVEQTLRYLYVSHIGERGDYTKATVAEIASRLEEAPVSSLGLDGITGLLTEMSIVGRLKGPQALADLIPAIDEPLLSHGVELAASDTDPSAVRSILEGRKQTLLNRQERQYEMFLEGMKAIQNGENPRVIEQRVRSFYE